jgi:predicted transcriptional regulator
MSMGKSGPAQPTEVELQILRILWELGPSRVREIHARLNANKGTNYSTTVKMLSVMLEKGIVRRDEEASPHIYRAALSREKAGKRMLSDLIERVYDGAAMSLILQALGTTSATRQELDEARRLLDRMEKKNP